MTTDKGSISRRGFLRTGVGVSVVGGVVLLGVSACSDDKSGDSDVFKGELPGSGLDSIVNNAPLIIGLRHGIYADHGLELKGVSAGGSDVVRAVLQSTNIGAPSAVSAMGAYSQGQTGIRLVSGLYHTTTAIQIVPADSKIESPKDLRGGKIAITGPGGASELLALRMVEEGGLTPDKDVKFVSIAGFPDAWTALSQGIVDSCHSAIPFATDLIASGKAKMLRGLRDYYPDYADVCLASTKEFIDSDPDTVKRFVDATSECVDFLKSDTDQAAEIFAKEMNITPEVSKQALTWTGSLDVFSMDLVDEELEATAEAGLALKSINPDGFKTSDIQNLVTTQFLK